MSEPVTELAFSQAGYEASSRLASPLDDLGALRIFVRVVETGSFSEVARRVGVTPATVSKSIAGLESRLHVRLLNRTTRHLFVTEAGQRLYNHGLAAIAELERAAIELADLQDTPAGHLRVTAPLLLGQQRLSPRLSEFFLTYPEITCDLSFSVDKVDLFKERIDVAIRIADEIDPGFVAIKLAPYRRLFCASPGYLARRGTPQTPEDLVNHNCLISRGSRLNSDWPVVRNGQTGHVRVAGNMSADNGDVVRHAALASVGIMMTARWMVDDDLREGRLVQVLAEYTPADRAIYAVLLQRTDSSRKLAAFVDFLKGCFSDLP